MRVDAVGRHPQHLHILRAKLLVRLAKQDLTFRTALLEARFLWGDQALFLDFRKTFQDRVVAGTALEFVDGKLTERDVRHKKLGDSRYLVEPNVKDGKGGLRDLQTP